MDGIYHAYTRYIPKLGAPDGGQAGARRHGHIWNSIHLDILVCTGMYEYVPGRTMPLNVFACIQMSQYIMRHTDLYRLVLVCTSMYFQRKYILIHTSTYKYKNIAVHDGT